MIKIYLRKIKHNDKKYFAKWWRDKELLRLTSGQLRRIPEKKFEEYFQATLRGKNNYDFMITANKRTIGHICLAKRKRGWHEILIVIGEKQYWNKGYGTKSIQLLLRKAGRLGIYKIYLEVRPTNARAIRAYEHCGFQKIRTVLYPKNKYLPKTLRMELR